MNYQDINAKAIDLRCQNGWQWAGPSAHICYQAGFHEAFTMEAGYATGPKLK